MNAIPTTCTETESPSTQSRALTLSLSEWTGYCAGQNESCLVPMFSDRNTTAWFGPEPTPTPSPTPTGTKSPSPTHTASPRPTASIGGTSVTPAPGATPAPTGLSVRWPTPTASPIGTSGGTPAPSRERDRAPRRPRLPSRPAQADRRPNRPPLRWRLCQGRNTLNRSRPLIFVVVFVARAPPRRSDRRRLSRWATSLWWLTTESRIAETLSRYADGGVDRCIAGSERADCSRCF